MRNREGAERGFTLLEILMVATIIAVLAATLYSQVAEAAKIDAYHGVTMKTMRNLAESMELYANRDFDGDGASNYPASLEELAAHGLVSKELAVDSAATGYYYSLTASVDRSEFMIIAEPMRPGRTGEKHFYVDQLGIIRATRDPLAPLNDWPPIQ